MPVPPPMSPPEQFAMLIELSAPTSWQSSSLAVYGPFAGPRDARADRLSSAALGSGATLARVVMLPLRHPDDVDLAA